MEVIFHANSLVVGQCACSTSRADCGCLELFIVRLQIWFLGENPGICMGDDQLLEEAT